MAISEQSPFEEYEEGEEGEEDNISLSGESDPDGDSDEDPSYSFLEETNTKFSNLSIKKKSKSRIAEDQDEAEVDEKDFETVKKIIKAGQLERLKVEQCKVYLRKHRLRLSGNKNTLIQRIKEHLEISNGDEAEKKYPVSSFVVNCKGDACTGDVVLFEQNVYEMFNLASRCASGPPCGKRIVAGRIVKESYGAAKQQHTFTIEVLWSKGEKPLPPLHSLLIKGRNLYRLKTLRQKWEDEGERQRVLMEKHSRGSLARSNRETRIQVKGMRKLLRAESVSAMTDLKGNLSQANITAKEKKETQSQLSDLSACTNLMETGPQQPSVLQAASFFDSRNSGNKHPLFVDTRKPGIQLQHDTSIIDYRVRSDPPQCFFGLNAVRIHNPGSKQFHAERIHKHNPGSRQFHADYQLPNIHLHRQPLKSVNKIHPINLSRKEGYMKRQLCRYYLQGRCHFGDHCRFLHEHTEDRRQG